MSDIFWLEDNNLKFPAVDEALTDPDGLLAVGGDLSSARLLEAYRSGIFPWYEEGQPILWWSPNPRCVLFPDKFHVSRSFKKKLRKHAFRVTSDQAFSAVVEHCAKLREGNEGTWITHSMSEAFRKLHQAGIAHSVEVWQEEKLVGGLYGIAMGRVFFGESMFSLCSDASKVALHELARQLGSLGFNLIDCQVHNDHLESLGATMIPRQSFINHLNRYIEEPTQSLWKPWSGN
ncbi:MAG: leucyl/phenylalanyl-tRNA--protein transferase [Pseudomonadales bacterium]